MISYINNCATREDLKSSGSLIIARKFLAIRHRIVFFDEEPKAAELLKNSKMKLMDFVMQNHAPVHERMVMTDSDWRSQGLRGDHGHAIVGPIVGDGDIVGLVALTREQGTMPFSDVDARDLGAICAHLSTWRESAPLSQVLTLRENEIAQLAGRGLTNREIGKRIGISENGVKQALKRIFRKLRITSRSAISNCLSELTRFEKS